VSPQASAEPREATSHWDAADLLTPVVLSETERRFRFRGLPQAVGASRRALREWERHFQPGLFYDLSLCVSELVTSRVQHGAGDEIELSVRRDERLVRAEISDPREDVVVTELPVTSPADWGMFIIDHVADRWGVDRGAPTLVWFEIDLTSEKPEASASHGQTRSLRGRGS
jgi:anti-sigma regulatory factor (Ser/Thr protein kinase)